MRLLTVLIVGLLAYLVSVSSSAGELWLSGYQSNSVGIFDSTSSALIAEIPVGQPVEDVEFSADGTIAFSTPIGGNLVKVINANTRQVIGQIDIGFVVE